MEERLRRLLWLRHGCPINNLYGDDGEMQCNFCMIDFKRDTPEEMELRWQNLNLIKNKGEKNDP